VTWPPENGEPLPRAADAWCERIKLTDWILAEEGHGAEWGRVFRVTEKDADLIWSLISAAIVTALIARVDEKNAGIGCGAFIELIVNQRTSRVATAWHYANAEAAPRLVTAYPKPYNRGNGRHG
jgi:hypothetical protein